MSIKTYRPTTPARRQMTVSGFEGVDKHAKPEKNLTEVLKKNAGRNSYGRITVRHQGGGHKQVYRHVDFRFDKKDIPAKIASIEYDPFRSAFIGKSLKSFQLWSALSLLRPGPSSLRPAGGAGRPGWSAPSSRRPSGRLRPSGQTGRRP